MSENTGVSQQNRIDADAYSIRETCLHWPALVVKRKPDKYPRWLIRFQLCLKQHLFQTKTHESSEQDTPFAIQNHEIQHLN